MVVHMSHPHDDPSNQAGAVTMSDNDAQTPWGKNVIHVLVG